MSDKQIKVTAMDGSKYIVCEVIDLPPHELNYVQLNLCVDDGRPVRPEGGHSMPKGVAESWMQGHFRVKINKPGGTKDA